MWLYVCAALVGVHGAAAEVVPRPAQVAEAGAKAKADIPKDLSKIGIMLLSNPTSEVVYDEGYRANKFSCDAAATTRHRVSQLYAASDFTFRREDLADSGDDQNRDDEDFDFEAEAEGWNLRRQRRMQGEEKVPYEDLIGDEIVENDDEREQDEAIKPVRITAIDFTVEPVGALRSPSIRKKPATGGARASDVGAAVVEELSPAQPPQEQRESEVLAENPSLQEAEVVQEANLLPMEANAAESDIQGDEVVAEKVLGLPQPVGADDFPAESALPRQPEPVKGMEVPNSFLVHPKEVALVKAQAVTPQEVNPLDEGNVVDKGEEVMPAVEAEEGIVKPKGVGRVFPSPVGLKLPASGAGDGVNAEMFRLGEAVENRGDPSAALGAGLHVDSGADYVNNEDVLRRRLRRRLEELPESEESVRRLGELHDDLEEEEVESILSANDLTPMEKVKALRRLQFDVRFRYLANHPLVDSEVEHEDVVPPALRLLQEYADTGIIEMAATSDILDVYTSPYATGSDKSWGGFTLGLFAPEDEEATLKVVYVCKKEGEAAISATVTTASGSKLCFSWVKACEATWGQLEIVEVTSGLSVFRNNKITNDWLEFLGNEGDEDVVPIQDDEAAAAVGEPVADGSSSSQFVFSTSHGASRIKDIELTSSNPEVDAELRGWMAERGEEPLQIGEEFSEKLDVIYRCPNAGDETKRSTISLTIENESPLIEPVKITWASECRAVSVPAMKIVSKNCHKADGEGEVVEVYANGQVAQNFQPGPGAHYHVPDNSDCTKFIITAPIDVEIPDMWPRPTISYNRDVLWMNAKVPEVVRAQNKVMLTVPYTCLEENSSKVQLILHFANAPALSLEWAKDCRKPQRRTGWALTAKSAMAIGSLALLGVLGLVLFTPIVSGISSMVHAVRGRNSMATFEELANLGSQASS